MAYDIDADILAVKEAIARVAAGGVAEYQVEGRRVKYHGIGELKKYLQQLLDEKNAGPGGVQWGVVDRRRA